MITPYSFAIATIFFSVAMLFVFALRRNTVFLVKYSVNTLIIITILCFIRLIFPIDVASKFIIRSDEWLPYLEKEILGKEFLGITIGQMLLFVWIAGGIYTLIRSAITVYKEMKYFYDLEDAGAEDYLPIINELCPSSVKIVVSPLIDTPQCIGLPKPCIYLPDKKFSEYELRYILLHEMQHIKSHDSYIKLFYMILKAIFWWNLVVRFFAKDLDRILELRCDDRVISAMSMEEKITYIRMLQKMKESLNPNMPYYNSLYTFVNPEDDLKQRAKLIAVHHRKTKRAFATIVVGALLVFVSSYFVIVQPANFPDMEENNEIMVITAENAYLIQVNEDTYYLQCNDANYDNTQPIVIPKEGLTVEPFSQLEIREIEEELQ